MRQFLLIICSIILLTSCQKEYEVEIERIEIWRGDVKHLSKDYKKETIKAKNDQEAAEKAYQSYGTNILTFDRSEQSNSEFLWLPVNYTIKDSKGNTISKNLDILDTPTIEYMITDEIANRYYEWVGGFKYNGTPYGQRHPRRIEL